MNRTTLLIRIIALAAMAPLALADDPNVPKKFQNASPEIRAAYGLTPTPSADEPVMDLGLLRRLAGRDGAHCTHVKVSGPVKFRNRTLVEIPDIKEPGLRLANQLMSEGCFGRAIDELEKVTQTDPANVHAKYVIARFTWMRLGVPQAEQMLTRVITEHPDFASAKVLLAGIRFGQNKLPESAALLDAAEPRSPTDLWIYLGRLRLEALQSPNADLRARLLEIMRNPAFPPNAREGAVQIAELLPQDKKQYEELLWASMDIDSNIGMPCKAAKLAFWLSESEGRFADVIKLLESPRAKEGNCLGMARNRTLLAQAYLMEAAKISAGPTQANKHLTDRADQILNGDYTTVAAHAQPRPQYATLKPFLDAFVHPAEVDSHGNTKLCHAIRQLNVALVREHLDAGADPNGRCDDRAPVEMLVFMATKERDEQRRDIMRALLEHGAKVTHIDACRSPNSGDCRQVLLPVMEQYAK